MAGYPATQPRAISARREAAQLKADPFSFKYIESKTLFKDSEPQITRKTLISTC